MTCEYIEFPFDQAQIGATSDVAPFSFPPEGASLPFFFTDQTFTEVLSALWNGAIITYPDRAYQVIWYFLQNVEAPVSLCDQIAECIATNPGTQSAIRNFVTGDTTINQHIQNVSRVGQPMPEIELPTPVVQYCDPDTAWAAVDAVVEQMNTNNIDFFQVFEGETNLVERASALLAAVPVFQTLPFDDMVAFVNTLFEDIYEEYEGVITTDLLNEYKCDLFCIGINDPDCILRFDAMYDYFADRIGSSLTTASLFQQAIEFLATGNWSGTLVADFMFMMQIQVVRSASDFLGLNVLSMQTVAQIGALIPSSAWELICPTCVTPENDWVIIRDYPGSGGYGGQIVSETSNSVVLQAEEYGGEYRIIARYKDFDQTLTLTGATTTGPTIATYHGDSGGLFIPPWENSAITTGTALRWIYIAASGPTTVTMTW